MDFSPALVGMAEPFAVRRALLNIREFEAALPRNPRTGARKFTPEQCCGRQILQAEFQRMTTLALLDCESGVLSFHKRPDHYLAAPPLAALKGDEGDE